MYRKYTKQIIWIIISFGTPHDANQFSSIETEPEPDVNDSR